MTETPTESIKAATKSLEHRDGKTEYVRRIEKWLERVTPKEDVIDKVVELFDCRRDLAD